jgi:hypothetical protein
VYLDPIHKGTRDVEDLSRVGDMYVIHCAIHAVLMHYRGVLYSPYTVLAMHSITLSIRYWSGYFITQGRMAKSMFASPYKDLGLQLMIMKTKDEQSLVKAMSAVIYPFMPELWILIILTAVFAGMVMWYVGLLNRLYYHTLTMHPSHQVP